MNKTTNYLLLTFGMLFLFQANVNAQLKVTPDSSRTATLLNVSFTDPTFNFTNISFCVSPSLFLFEHESKAYSFQPITTQYVNSDTMTGIVGVPSNALLGKYDVRLTTCGPLACSKCFEVYPDTVVIGDDVAIYMSAVGAPTRGFASDYILAYQNKGNDTADVDIELIHDPVMVYNTTTVPYNSRVGNTIKWTINDVLPGAFGVVWVNLTIPATVPLGDTLQFNTTILPVVGDLNVTDNYFTLRQVVVGSYDPNDKTAFPGSLIPKDIDKITYKVRFQNTGTATAKKVVIVDTLSSKFDVNSIKTVASSHGYLFELVAGTPNTLKWTFHNINLPDSGNSLLGSQGFIEYTVAPLPGLSIRDSIENFADIYFDFNAPVRTDTTKNYVFDCDSLANFELLTDSLCLGEAIEAVQNGFGAVTLTWTLGGVIIDSVPVLSSPTTIFGKQELQLVASNFFCSNAQSDSLYVIEVAPPIVTKGGTILTSSVADSIQWYLDGVPLTGEVNDSLEADQNGWYKVLHISSEGCALFSDSVEVTEVGLNEITGFGQLSIYPNPSLGRIKISTLLTKKQEVQLQVYSVTGQKVINQSLLLMDGPQVMELDMSAYQKGTYIVVLSNEDVHYRQVIVLME